MNLFKKNYENQKEISPDLKTSKDKNKKISYGIIGVKGVDVIMEYEHQKLDKKQGSPKPPEKTKNTLPNSPLSIYKDSRKNDYLNFFWNKFSEIGLLQALSHEENFRTAKIKLLKPFQSYPLNFSQKSTGFLYDDTYLDLFPQPLKRKFKEALTKEYKLVFLKKIPFMIKKENFTVIKELRNNMQLDLLT